MSQNLWYVWKKPFNSQSFVTHFRRMYGLSVHVSSGADSKEVR